jgi:hypothetical protein
MPAEEMRIAVPALIGHAGSVDSAADGMETGRSAAAQVRMGGEAYGKICAFLPALIDPIGETAVSALAEAASSLRETAANLRTVAADVSAADQAAGARTTSAGRMLELPL